MSSGTRKINKDYKLSCDLFQLEYKDGHKILYAPRLLFAFVANPDLQNLIGNVIQNRKTLFTNRQMKVLDYLESKGVFNHNMERTVEFQTPKEFKPTSLTLFPTNRCNLRCIYCYASAGDFKPMKIKWIYVTTAIDFVIKNLLEANAKNFYLGFHGGGEPLYEWALVKKIIEYAKQKCVENDMKLTIGAATNGILSKNQLEYIVENFESLSISFDGNAYSQNLHRPLINGKGSFENINKTIKYLDSKGFRYGIRSTVSAETMDQMEDIVHFISQNYKCKIVQLEPIANTGRCLFNSSLTIDLQKFSEKFTLCYDSAVKGGIQLTYSGCKIENLTNSFCGVSNDSFAVTPDGHLATCFEVTSREDPRSGKFFIGRITGQGEIEIDEQKREYLKKIKVSNIEYCSDCFAKWHCAGDCMTRIGHENLLGTRGHDRCGLNREMIREKIIRWIESDSDNN